MAAVGGAVPFSAVVSLELPICTPKHFLIRWIINIHDSIHFHLDILRVVELLTDAPPVVVGRRRLPPPPLGAAPPNSPRRQHALLRQSRWRALPHN